jgi:hypothetical protein
MDDNTFATSDDSSSQDPHFATEVETEIQAPAREAEAPQPSLPAEPEPKAEKPEAPKSTREALEQAYEAAQAKAEGKEAPVAAPVTQAAIEPVPQPQALKAPQSWKAEAREAFNAAPPLVQQEALRREKEISTTLAQTAAERKLASEFLATAQPYEAMYRSKGMDPLVAAKNLFNADYILNHGNTQAKVSLVGTLLKGWSSDELSALDGYLAGNAPTKAQTAQIDPVLQQKLDRLEQFANQQSQVAQQEQQRAQVSVNNDIETFANNPKNEFFNDVAPHMVALLQSGAASTLPEAYEQACYANQSVRKVLTQREQANKARLQASGASLPNKGPRNNNQPAPRFKTNREALEAAFAQYESQARV